MYKVKFFTGTMNIIHVDDKLQWTQYGTFWLVSIIMYKVKIFTGTMNIIHVDDKLQWTQYGTFWLVSISFKKRESIIIINTLTLIS